METKEDVRYTGAAGEKLATANTLLHRLDSNHAFVEYLSAVAYNDHDADHVNPNSSKVEALVVHVDPKDGSRIVKALSQCLPLPASLQHLKRVKKQSMDSTMQQEDDGRSPPNKRPKTVPGHRRPLQLQILLGLAPLSKLLESSSKSTLSESLLLDILRGGKGTATADAAAANPPLKSIVFHTVWVPRRPPQSQDEADQANQVWPTHFFPLSSLEYKQRQLAVPPQQLQLMLDGVQTLSQKYGEAFIVDPMSNQMIAKSVDEDALQAGGGISQWNPLVTPILLAIQGVSRLERQGSNHYLCSGYHLYCNYEPTVFESMACVHSRLRRIVWAAMVTSPPRSVWQHGLSQHSIHCLPGTNHHFRAFEYAPPAQPDVVDL